MFTVCAGMHHFQQIGVSLSEKQMPRFVGNVSS